MATRSKKAVSAGPATRGLKVVSRTASFYRAGRQFTAEPTTVPLSELTPEQLEAITDEPMLVSQEVDIEPAEDAAADT